KADVKTRQKALETLIDARPDDLRKLCESLLDVRILNGTAARGLSLFNDREVASLLTQKYRRFHPDDRPRVIEALVSRPTFAAVLLDALEKSNGPIPLTDVTAVHARQIKSLDDEALTKRLSEVWGELRESSAERRELKAKLVAQLTPEARRQADLSAGRALFTTKCSLCHKLYGEGKKVGPDLTGAQRSSLDYLLENILDPSAVVGKDYRVSTIETIDGRVLSGLIVSKDAQTLTLQTAVEQLTINQEDVEEIRDSPLSAMPDGLLQNLSDDQIRDLIAYLMHPSQVPLSAKGAE
ncbi:MAG TPA: c-type cytochrome, partial [Pirellulales bacterium]